MRNCPMNNEVHHAKVEMLCWRTFFPIQYQPLDPKKPRQHSPFLQENIDVERFLVSKWRVKVTVVLIDQ